MSDSERRFTHESLQDPKTVKALLTALAKGVSKGEMTLGDDDGDLVLKTAGLMNVRIKAEREDGQCQVSLRLTWSDPSEAAHSKGAPRIDS
ncbi:amphi-Trp domain-containing protein [Pseudooceanicola algae]|uniref:Amphi-Trp domain-containing protein n=1 Tax=Pseudooceanicola algae TaxID=1537215 RepID=A0A418SBU1_9RHOB|nr:amphi-Trp domain-containing protein [Pseudooceanicola algae]QPM92529.1 hypothetical protein PSAL_037930 [Pseudooceanicola algae]